MKNKQKCSCPRCSGTNTETLFRRIQVFDGLEIIALVMISFLSFWIIYFGCASLLRGIGASEALIEAYNRPFAAVLIGAFSLLMSYASINTHIKLRHAKDGIDVYYVYCYKCDRISRRVEHIADIDNATPAISNAEDSDNVII